MFADLKSETDYRQELKSLQLQRLKKTVQWAYKRSVFYHDKFYQERLHPDEIATLDDIKKLPYTTKQDLTETDFHDFLTLPLSGVARLDMWNDERQPIFKAYTAEDIKNYSVVAARALKSIGVGKGSVVGFIGSLPTAAVTTFLAALSTLGATGVVLGDDFPRALRLMEATGLETLAGDAKVIMQLIIKAQAVGKDILEFPFAKIICFNEAIHNPLLSHIEHRTATRVFQVEISTGLGMAGAIFQCSDRIGFHIAEEEILAEIVSLDGKETITDGSSIGELVVTTLTAEAMPIIRYRTGQMVRFVDEPCPCGERLRRISTPLTQVVG